MHGAISGLWLLTLLGFIGLVTTDNPYAVRIYDWVDLPSKVFSGVVGDRAHQIRGGYHIGRILNMPGNYSITFLLDQTGDPLMACGIDISFNPTDMIKATSRIIAAMKAGDPRVAVVRGVNGTLNGQTTINYDITLHGQNYQPDGTHLWHIHVELWRSRITSAAQGSMYAKGLADVINGVPLGATGTTNPTQEVDDMSITKTILVNQRECVVLPTKDTPTKLTIAAMNGPAVLRIASSIDFLPGEQQKAFSLIQVNPWATTSFALPKGCKYVYILNDVAPGDQQRFLGRRNDVGILLE